MGGADIVRTKCGAMVAQECTPGYGGPVVHSDVASVAETQLFRILSALCPHYSRSLSAPFPQHLRNLSARESPNHSATKHC